MTRARVLLRHPAVWLGLLLFAAAGWVGHRYAAPEPESVVRTGNVRYPDRHGLRMWGEPRGWSEVHGVLDDSSQILTGFYEGGKFVEFGQLQLWNLPSGLGRTVIEREEFDGRQRWMDRTLLDHPEGRQFLLDESARASVRKRLARTEMRGDELRTEWPRELQFSPDARVLSYLTRNGKPVFRGDDAEADGTVVEDVRTGQRVAFLPGVTDRLDVDLAPGGKTAVSRQQGANREDPPRLTLWDLETSTRRAELAPGFDYPRVYFDPSGRCVFASGSAPGERGSYDLRWWDTATGRVIGHVKNKDETTFLDGGTVLVTQHQPARKDKATRPNRLCFWDVATGESRGEWYPDVLTPVYPLIGSAHPRYLCGRIHLDRTLTDRVVDRLDRAFGNTPTYDNQRFVVWDVVERREVLRVPGKSAALSPNGQRLATIDDAGVVRVWQLPPPVRWGRILGQAALAAVIGGPTLVLFGRLVRHGWRTVRTSRVWRAGRWLLTGRRWWATLAVVVLALFACVGRAVHLAVAERARTELRAVYEEIEDIHATPGLTEAEVTALVGRPPDAGPVQPMAGPSSGGGYVDDNAGLRKWTRYGTELDVYFSPAGKVRSVYISCDQPDLLEQLARWLGL